MWFTVITAVPHIWRYPRELHPKVIHEGSMNDLNEVCWWQLAHFCPVYWFCERVRCTLNSFSPELQTSLTKYRSTAVAAVPCYYNSSNGKLITVVMPAIKRLNKWIKMLCKIQQTVIETQWWLSFQKHALQFYGRSFINWFQSFDNMKASLEPRWR